MTLGMSWHFSYSKILQLLASHEILELRKSLVCREGCELFFEIFRKTWWIAKNLHSINYFIFKFLWWRYKLEIEWRCKGKKGFMTFMKVKYIHWHKTVEHIVEKVQWITEDTFKFLWFPLLKRDHNKGLSYFSSNVKKIPWYPDTFIGLCVTNIQHYVSTTVNVLCMLSQTPDQGYLNWCHNQEAWTDMFSDESLFCITTDWHYVIKEKVPILPMIRWKGTQVFFWNHGVG